MYNKYFCTLFSFNFFLYNKSNVANYNVCTINDYAILLTNLNDIYGFFNKNLEYMMKEEFKNRNKKLKIKLYIDILGFKPGENMSKFDKFKKFLEKKIFQKNGSKSPQYFDINSIKNNKSCPTKIFRRIFFRRFY